MDSLELLEKRKHVHSYDMSRHPPKETIEKVLWKAWKVTSSKNKMMPYSIFILGPDREWAKQLVYERVVQNHADVEYKAAKAGKEDAPDFVEDINEFTKPFFEKPNESYFHIKENSYLMHESHINKIKDMVSVEVGMFAQNLTTFCMEEEIDISYCSCFQRDIKKWAELPFVKYQPRLLASLGYGDKYRRRNADDLKPEPEEIIEWI